MYQYCQCNYRNDVQIAVGDIFKVGGYMFHCFADGVFLPFPEKERNRHAENAWPGAFSDTSLKINECFLSGVHLMFTTADGRILDVAEYTSDRFAYKVVFSCELNKNFDEFPPAKLAFD